MEAVRESLRDEALRRAVVRAVRAQDLISEAQCVQVRRWWGCCCGSHGSTHSAWVGLLWRI